MAASAVQASKHGSSGSPVAANRWSEHQMESNPARSTATAACKKAGHDVRSVQSRAPSRTRPRRGSDGCTEALQIGSETSRPRSEQRGVRADTDEPEASLDIAAGFVDVASEDARTLPCLLACGDDSIESVAVARVAKLSGDSQCVGQVGRPDEENVRTVLRRDPGG